MKAPRGRCRNDTLARRKVTLADTRWFVWSSSPSFRSESDALTAYGWTVELVEYGHAFGLIPQA